MPLILDDEELLDTKEMANFLSCHPSSVCRKARNGLIPKPIYIGNKAYYSKETSTAHLKRISRRDFFINKPQ